MREQRRNRWAVVLMAMLVVSLSTLGLAGTASAKLTKEYARFQYCPYTTPGVERCIVSITESGEVVLGNKKVPITKPVTLQGGYTELSEEELEKGVKFAKFYGATNGITLSKAPQNVPGGLAGFVNCKEISNFLLRVSCEAVFENGLTGVDATLELSRPASEIQISENHLAEGEGVALRLPVQSRLENPFLGSNCVVGSSSSPIWWELTTGITNPPKPNGPISGKIGQISFLESATILKIDGNELVDNAWAAPAASGCGGLFSFIIDPIVNSSSALPSAAGRNSAKLKNTVYETTSFSLKKNNAENP